MNKVIMTCRVGKDPQISTYGPNQKKIAKFSAAVDKRFKKPNEPTVDWFNFVAFDTTAEHIERYVKQGKQLAIVGTLTTSAYTDKNNEKRIKWEIIIDQVEFLGSKNDGNNESAAPKAEVQTAAPVTAEEADDAASAMSAPPFSMDDDEYTQF